jgi:dihydrofolate reductase
MNVVLSKTVTHVPDADATFASLDDALLALYNAPNIESIFVIGGGEVYAAALERMDVGMIYKSVMHIRCPSDADAFFPTLDTSRFQLLRKTQNPEASYHLEYWGNSYNQN